MNTVQRVDNWLDKSGPKLLELLPAGIDQARFLRNVSSQVKMNPLIQNCRPDTIINSIVKATHLGLDIGVLGSAYLVPYGNQASLIIGFAGLIDLAFRSGTVKNIHSGVVRENDDYLRTHDDFTHDYRAFDTLEHRGQVVGAYCLVDLSNGGRQIETMSRDDIDQIRSASKSGHGPAWSDYFDEMAKKSVIRRALKRIKLSPEVQEVIQASDDAEFIPAEVRPPAKQTKKRGVGALASKLSEKPASAPEPEEADFSVVSEVVEEDAPEAAPEPHVEPVQDIDVDVWDLHKDKANQLAQRMGDPIRKWYKIKKTNREKMLIDRIKAEGFTVSQVEEFWEVVFNAFLPFDTSKVADWKDNCDLDVLLRVPKKGNKDHFVAAQEGAYKGSDFSSEPVAALQIEDLIQD